MIEEPGIVVAVDDDGIWVATQRKTTCGSCSAKAVCGQGLLNSLSADKKPHTVKVRSDLQLREGDQVVLAISQQSLVRSAFLVYMLPLFLMFAAALTVDALNASEPWIIFAAGLGFLAGAVCVRLYSNRYLDDAAMQPVVVKAQIALRPALDV
ncbi:transcriptional regulator [Pseudomonas sp. C27(2019)]|uniref:SoxR reducing system RseC family protein n=1 Tax=Pseudomonas sp. C27(2019) TaxID=2604941 RepID=UPI0012443453|nr:SoxR reducing system RseC family protein [Pseudomonas sp. C27(2019)]QEY58988.1 transcriptional regulator [Pseudomonas sp. C27(2019)]